MCTKEIGIEDIRKFNEKWLGLQAEYEKISDKGRHLPYPEPLQKLIVKKYCDWNVEDNKDSKGDNIKSIDFKIGDKLCEMKSTTKLDGAVNFSEEQLKNSQLIIWFYVDANIKKIFVMKMDLKKEEENEICEESYQYNFFKANYVKSRKLNDFFSNCFSFVETKIFDMKTMKEVWIINNLTNPQAPYLQTSTALNFILEKESKNEKIEEIKKYSERIYIAGNHLSSEKYVRIQSLRNLLSNEKSKLYKFFRKNKVEIDLDSFDVKYNGADYKFTPSSALQNSKRDLDFVSFYVCNVDEKNYDSLDGSASYFFPEIINNIDQVCRTNLSSKWNLKKVVYNHMYILPLDKCQAFDGREPYDTFLDICDGNHSNSFYRIKSDEIFYVNIFKLKKN